MKPFTVKETQNCSLYILEAFQQYCDKEGLRYYMAGGTLLGAVRHHGYIPWDDDVDMMMPRSDYERFIHGYKNEQYKVISCETDHYYSSPYAKLWDTRTEYVIDSPNWINRGANFGAFIDIFPIDGYPDSDYAANLYAHYLKHLRKIINIAAVRTSKKINVRYIKNKFLNTFIYRKAPNYYARQLNRIAQKKSFDACTFVGVATSFAHILKERNKKTDVFSGTVLLPFEHLFLPAPAGYDLYLHRLYGDYMKLPPPDKQVSDHKFRIYWRE